MNLFRKAPKLAEMDDAHLVMQSLDGDRDAFCQIVTRYQNLLCALAYSSVGDSKQSEDIAQETFIEAWKKLETLAEPAKLKAWLCGILRFKISRFRRKETASPLNASEELTETNADKASAEDAAENSLETDAIKSQHDALVWKVISQIDATYREPLVLFYREQQSIERVAEELDLTTDTVKQRLSRGRKMLKSALSDLVEDGLKGNKPGVAFTALVMTAISSISPPATAAFFGSSASAGAGAAKSGSAIKLTSVLVFLASISGLISSYFGLKAGLAQSRTQRERKQVIKYVSLFFLFVFIYIIGILGFNSLAKSATSNITVFASMSQAWVMLFVVCYFKLTFSMLKALKTLRAQERIFNPEAFASDVNVNLSLNKDEDAATEHSTAEKSAFGKSSPNDVKQHEYKSRLSLFGIPLFHFQFGMPEKNQRPAFGWISGGSLAYGVIFAWGGVAVAPISVGIIAVGGFSIGAVGIGLFGLGTVGIGLIGFGASAIGYKAYASFSSLGWESAFSNGVSIAKDAAIAPVAIAEHVNNEQAYSIASLEIAAISYPWILAAISVLVVVPAVWHYKSVVKRMG